MARSNKDFGRDEFSSLLGATGEREALEAVREAAKPKAIVARPPRRHRDPTRQRAYHEVLDETILQETNDANAEYGEKQDETDAFTAATARQRRAKAAPVILSSTTADSATRKPSARGHADDPSSSSSDDQGLRNRADDSSSSDDDSIDERRRRLLSQRKRQAPQVIQEAMPSLDQGIPSQSVTENEPSQPPRAASPVGQRPKRARNESSSSSASSGSSEDDDSSSEEEENDATAIRPVFIPKHQRGLKASIVAPLAATNAKPIDERRVKESRALVQQAVTTVKKEVKQGVPTIDGVIGAMNDVPDDSDSNLDHMEWVIRELERLLLSRDLEEERLAEQAERERRRNMTDEERMAEDAEQAQSQPKLDRKNQRFFHKGAFYMDESEWDESDVRMKATEYAAAVTGDDKRDRSQLPKVMQVKKFGFANQSKWKGLAKEDTTDKRMEMLPLRNVPKKK